MSDPATPGSGGGHPSASPHAHAVGTRWGDPISEARRAELDALAERQRAWAKQPEAELDLSSYFKGVRLTGADVFWLAVRALAGPEGDLAAAQVALLTEDPRSNADHSLSELHLEGAILDMACLEGSNLREAHLERVTFTRAHLERTVLTRAHLEGASLVEAHLEDASLRETYLLRAYLGNAHLERADLREAHLESADLHRTHLESADLTEARLERADLGSAHLEGALFHKALLAEASLRAAHLQGADLRAAHLKQANLSDAQLAGANLWESQLEGANLSRAQLDGADLQWAQLKEANLRAAHLAGTDLRGTVVDSKTVLNDAIIDARTRLGDIQWGGVGVVNLTQIDWSHIQRIGDETQLKQGAKTSDHEAVVRAYRQLAAQLRAQGISEAADRLSERAQVVQRRVLRRQRRLGQWLFSGFLNLLAGYGYRPARTVFWYLAIVLGFAGYYVALAPAEHIHLTFLGALVLSVSSFHGRGFFPGIPGTTTPLDSPLTVSAAGEAIIGLLIEISFIATFTQRYFGAR